MTIQEFKELNPETLDDMMIGRSNYENRIAIEFAKHHVKEALKKAEQISANAENLEVVNEAIINCYSEDRIK